ncbi:MAG: hypothetical protein QM817_20335 [Archangium sp.]
MTGLVILAVGCATQAPVTRPAEALYLAVEVQEHGKTVARPKVVGFEGKNITVERRQPDSPQADYKLVLLPKEEGGAYGVKLDLELPSGRRLGHVGLLHGEERRVQLGSDIELKVMLMRVDSPEFKSLMQKRPKLGKPAI